MARIRLWTCYNKAVDRPITYASCNSNVGCVHNLLEVSFCLFVSNYNFETVSQNNEAMKCWSFWLIWFINQRALYNHALSVIVIGVILHRHQHQHHLLCTPPPGTWLDIEASYLVPICTYIPHICSPNI